MWGREEGASYLSWCSGEPRLVCCVPCLRAMGNELISNHMEKKNSFFSNFSFLHVCMCTVVLAHKETYFR